MREKRLHQADTVKFVILLFLNDFFARVNMAEFLLLADVSMAMIHSRYMLYISEGSDDLYGTASGQDRPRHWSSPGTSNVVLKLDVFCNSPSRDNCLKLLITTRD